MLLTYHVLAGAVQVVDGPGRDDQKRAGRVQDLDSKCRPFGERFSLILWPTLPSARQKKSADSPVDSGRLPGNKAQSISMQQRGSFVLI